MRPIENAMDGPKKTISDLFRDLGSAIVDANSNDVVCSSTEEILQAFEDYNKKCETSNERDIKLEENIIGSMDAVSLFTRLEAETSAEIIKEETMRSGVKFENIDTNELVMFLKKNLKDNYIKRNGLEGYLPEWITNKKTSAESNKKNKNKENNDAYDFVEDIVDLFDYDEEDDAHETVVESNVIVDLQDESSQEDEDKNKKENKNDSYYASRGVKKNGVENEATE